MQGRDLEGTRKASGMHLKASKTQLKSILKASGMHMEGIARAPRKLRQGVLNAILIASLNAPQIANGAYLHLANHTALIDHSTWIVCLNGAFLTRKPHQKLTERLLRIPNILHAVWQLQVVTNANNGQAIGFSSCKTLRASPRCASLSITLWVSLHHSPKS